MLLADYASYVKVQETVSEAFMVKLTDIDNLNRKNLTAPPLLELVRSTQVTYICSKKRQL